MAFAVQVTAFSRLQSSKTTAGDLPPSSRVTRFRFDFAAISWIFLPVGIEPVNETFRIFIWLASSAPVLPSPDSTWNTPGGNPASLINGPRAREANGVFSEGLRMKQLPVARAGAAFRPTVPRGPFQGTMPAVTPKGSLRTILRKPSSCGKDWPANLSIQPALYLKAWRRQQ